VKTTCCLRPEGPIAGVRFLGVASKSLLHQQEGSEEHCKISQRGPGQSIGRSIIFLYIEVSRQIFCYAIKGTQQQKSLNLAAREGVVLTLW